MAVPVNATIFRGAALKSGVMLGVSPSSDPTFDVEIARATSSGVYETVNRLSPNTAGVYPSYTDILPVTTSRFSYKARAVKDGYLAGDYTSVVTAKPITLPEVPPPITPVTGRPLGVNLYLSTGPVIKFGSPNTQTYFRKRFRAAAADFISRSSSRPWAIDNSGALNPNSTSNSTGVFYAPVSLPTGSITRSFSVLVYRGTTGAYVSFNFVSRDSTGGLTLVGMTSTATGYHYLTSTAFSVTVTTAKSYYIELRMASNNAAKDNARLVWFDFIYDTPNVQGSI